MKSSARWFSRGARHRTPARYQALVGPGTELTGRALLPVLAEALAVGTRAESASIWIPDDGTMTRAAAWPAGPRPGPAEVAGLAELRTVAGAENVVALGDVRCALVIAKSGRVRDDDRAFMRDMANRCAPLLRGIELDTKLRERVRRAEELGEELRASQDRLVHAREGERRRLAGEIADVTTGNLAAIRAELRHLDEALASGGEAAERVLARLRPSLDELIERFRAVVRGVYPGVLRDEGPRAALEELAGDLPNPVRFTGQLPERADWELESGLYYLVASALRMLSGGRSSRPLRVHFDHHDAQLTVRIDGAPDALAPSTDIRAALANDADRVAGLGGGLLIDDNATRISVQAWLPLNLDPAVTGPLELPDTPTETPGNAPSSTGAETSLSEAIRRVVLTAAEKYPGAPVGDALIEIATRLDEPFRVALAGPAGAGKSSLVNALVGEELAPTGGRTHTACTGCATWYRDAPTCAITMYPRRGRPRPIEFSATGAAAAAELAGTAIDTVDHLVVEWPAPALRRMTLIDLPGTDAREADGDTRSREVLIPGGHGMPTADAVVYVAPDLRATDLEFLRNINEDPRWCTAVTAVVVLTRADEAGRDGPGAIESAERIAARFRRDDQIRQVCQTVLPVSPLLAASGATLRKPEYEAFRRLASVTEDGLANTLERAEYAPLLARFGLFGARSAVEAIRSGRVSGVGDLSAELVRHSGIQPLRDLLTTRLAERATISKARSALLGIEEVAGGLPPDDPYRESLRYQAERIRAGAHEIAEIELVGRLHRDGPALGQEDLAIAERLLGAEGTDPCSRLGLPRDADPATVHREAAACLRRWQRLAESPVPSRRTAETCQTLIRTCEGLLARSA